MASQSPAPGQSVALGRPRQQSPLAGTPLRSATWWTGQPLRGCWVLVALQLLEWEGGQLACIWSLRRAPLMLDFHGNASQLLRPPASLSLSEWLCVLLYWMCLWMTTYWSDGAGRRNNLFRVIIKKPKKRSNYSAVNMQFVILLWKYLELLGVSWAYLWISSLFLINP